ncbi:MAG: STAS domain-containing protein [Actinomycetota bacterium]|nr:STAS domain-containing protein [Actinomycetota bacterium]
MNIAPFNVKVESLDDVVVFSISGELDQATASDLRDPLMETVNGETRAVLIDMADCGFIDSTGLGVIVEAWKLLEARDGERAGLSICCPKPEVKRLLEVTGLDQAIAIRDTRDEAIAALPS